LNKPAASTNKAPDKKAPEKKALNKTEETQAKPRRRGWWGVALGLAFGFCGLAASRLGYVWTNFDVISNFTVQFMFVVAAFALGGLIPRFKTLSSLAILVLLIAGYGAWPLLRHENQLPANAAAPAGTKLLRVASFNTKAKNKDIAALAMEIVRLDADIVTILELTPDKAGLLDLLKANYANQLNCNTDPHCKAAIVSKHALAATAFAGRWDGPPYMSATLGSEWGGVTVVGIHTQRFPNTEAHFRHARSVVKLVETVPGYVILMGDFNATPFSRIIKIVEEGTGFQRQTTLPSWPAQFGLPQLAIDHIFLSPSLKPMSPVQMGEAAGSDHLPVSMVVAVPVN
jgi:endonuclease/exonuclease/phosphatase (EEP) superfamily protein YafD